MNDRLSEAAVGYLRGVLKESTEEMAANPSYPSRLMPGGIERSVACAFGLIVVLAVASVLFSLVWRDGLAVTWKDPRLYLQSAINMANGEGLIARTYDIASDRLVTEVLTHYPPLISLVIGSFIMSGVPVSMAPTLMSFGAWAFLLVGCFRLASRWAGSTIAGCYAAAVVAIASPVIDQYKTICSEILFLPLLVWLAVCLPDPRQRPTARGKLLLCAVLASLLMLTRYVGIFVVASLIAWWALRRLTKVSRQVVMLELSILALSALPIAVWLTRNYVITGTLFGPTVGSGPKIATSFFSNLEIIIRQTTLLVLASAKLGAILRELGLFAAMAVGLFLIVGGLLLWRSRREGVWRFLVEGPLLALLPGYLLIHVVGPLFLYFRSLDERYMSPVVTLVLPMGIAWLWRAAAPLGRVYIPAYVGLNVVLLAVFAIRTEVLFGQNPYSSPIADYTGRQQEASAAATRGVPTWLLRRPPRLRDVEHRLPELHRWIENMPSSGAVVTNGMDLLITKQIALSSRPIEEWLDHGTCTPQGKSLAIVAIDWDTWTIGFEGAADGHHRRDLEERVYAKCPGAVAKSLPNALVLLLYPNKTVPAKTY